MSLMTKPTKKQPKEPLAIPLDFTETLEAMLKVKPPPDRKPSDGQKVKKDKKAEK